MPILKRNSWLRPVLPAGAIAFLAIARLVSGVGAQTEDNVVRIEPSGIEVGEGGSVTVAVTDVPPPESLAAWVIELSFDPDVLTTVSRDCQPMDTPGGAIGAFACEADDSDDDGRNDVVKILGAVIFSGSRKGLTREQVLADVAFDVVGDPGQCSDLKLRVKIHADSEGEDTGALVQDGEVCIRDDAPAEGTASPNPVTPRTSEPTPPGGVDETVPVPGASNGEGNTPGPGESGNTGATDGSSAGPGASGSSGAAGGSRTSAPGASNNPENPGNGDDGGVSPAVWVVVGLLVLGAVGAGAWAVVRRGAGNVS